MLSKQVISAGLRAAHIPTTSRQKGRREMTEEYFAGIITALLIVKLHDAGTIFTEIMATMSADEQRSLMSYADENGEYELVGFERYGFKLAERQT